MSNPGVLPTTDELFGDTSATAAPQAAANSNTLPTPDELFAPKPTLLQRAGGALNTIGSIAQAPIDFGVASLADLTRNHAANEASTPALDAFFSQTPAGQILKAFGHGAAYPFQAWQNTMSADAPAPDTAGFLKSAGVFERLEKNRSTTAKWFIDSTLRGLATTADATVNAVRYSPLGVSANIDYTGGVSSAFNQLKDDLFHLKPDLRTFGNDSLWGQIKQDFDAQLTMGKVPLDAFGAALSLTGIPQLVGKGTDLYGKAVARGMTALFPTHPGMETEEHLAARATADANFDLMFAGPVEGGTMHLSPSLSARLNAAREAGVIGAGETTADIASGIRQRAEHDAEQESVAGGFGTPEGVQPQNLAPSPPSVEPVADAEPVQPARPPSSGKPIDVEGVARQIAPDVFDKHDALSARHEWFNNWIAELQSARDANIDPRLPPLDTEIQTILGKVRGVEEKLTNKAAARLQELRDTHETIARAGQPDTADMAGVKEAMLKNYNEMQALALAMRDARNAARARMPLADLHEADAEQIKPEDAAEAAAHNTSENDTYAKEHAPEVHDEINAGQSSGIAAPNASLPSGTNEAGPVAGQTGETSNAGTIPNGDNAPVAEGGAARTQPEGKHEAKRGAVTFKTAKGSTYEVHEDGTTTRNKAARSDAGHEGDSGPKPRTVKTIYADTPDDAANLSAAGLQGLGPNGARVIIKDGKASLLTWNEKAGQWGISPGQRDIPISTEPGVGKAPVELWKPANDVPGYEAYSNMHAGNAITEVGRPEGGTPRASGTQRPVTGAGELKIRGLAQHVEEKAIEEGLTEGFGNLPEYRTVSMADQARQARELIDADHDHAMEIAMGTKKPPRGVLPESVFVAVEKRALAEGDIETLRKLATASKLTTEATTMGQRIRTLGERDPTSPVAAIKAVQDARENVAKARGTSDVKTATAAAVDDMKVEIKTAAPTKGAWAAFVQDIVCK